ncbi:MAG: L-threonylcarbamoyladenylate synthase [Holophagaceae bacterium]|nr:L-threonylcarbamoyladenylate synthase [Holophagaceae bacterium]
MILSIHPDNPQPRHLERVAELLRKDGVIAYPTDTLFGLGCLASRKKAHERILSIKGRDGKRPMSILCSDFEMLCRYTRHLETPTYRILKQILPGPYTAVLPASREVPRHLQNKQTVGLRIPSHAFCTAITKMMEEPIITTSCQRPGEPPMQTAWEIDDELGHILDIVIDCGSPENVASTILDFTTETITVIREGAGQWPI